MQNLKNRGNFSDNELHVGNYYSITQIDPENTEIKFSTVKWSISCEKKQNLWLTVVMILQKFENFKKALFSIVSFKPYFIDFMGKIVANLKVNA